jgi:hypothetical protein
MSGSRALAFLIKEFKEIIPPAIFFGVGFSVIYVTTQLILDDYLVRLANFMVVIGAALVVGKAVLVANALPISRRFDRAPLIQPILFKTVIYFLVVFLVRFLEKLAEYLLGGGTVAGIPDYVSTHFTWHRFAAIQIWILILFLLYTSIAELNAFFGKGELLKIIFTGRSSKLRPERS